MEKQKIIYYLLHKKEFNYSFILEFNIRNIVSKEFIRTFDFYYEFIYIFFAIIYNFFNASQRV